MMLSIGLVLENELLFFEIIAVISSVVCSEFTLPIYDLKNITLFI